MAETKRCPYCGEEILLTAKKCKHCKEWLEANETPKQFEPKDKVTAKSKNWGWMIIFPLAIIIVVVLVVSSLNSTFSSSNSENEIPSSVDTTSIAMEQQEEYENVIDEPAKDTEIEEVKRMLEHSNYTKYSNGRFGFSLSYPDCFVMGEEPENGDGCSFSLKYGISFSVWGSYNDPDWYGESIKDSYNKDEDGTSATYRVQRDNWYVMSGKVDEEKYFYKKVVLMEDNTDRGTYVTYYMIFPKKFDKALSNHFSYIAKNFNPKYEGSYSNKYQRVETIDPLKNMQVRVRELPHKEEQQHNLTKDQQMMLFLMLLAGASMTESDPESNSGFFKKEKITCTDCNMEFTDYGTYITHRQLSHGKL